MNRPTEIIEDIRSWPDVSEQAYVNTRPAVMRSLVEWIDHLETLIVAWKNTNPSAFTTDAHALLATAVAIEEAMKPKTAREIVQEELAGMVTEHEGAAYWRDRADRIVDRLAQEGLLVEPGP